MKEGFSDRVAAAACPTWEEAVDDKGLEWRSEGADDADAAFDGRLDGCNRS